MLELVAKKRQNLSKILINLHYQISLSNCLCFRSQSRCSRDCAVVWSRDNPI